MFTFPTCGSFFTSDGFQKNRLGMGRVPKIRKLIRKSIFGLPSEFACTRLKCGESHNCSNHALMFSIREWFHFEFRPTLAGHIIVPNFEENGICMLGVVVLFSQFSPIEIKVFDKKI